MPNTISTPAPAHREPLPIHDNERREFDYMNGELLAYKSYEATGNDWCGQLVRDPYQGDEKVFAALVLEDCTPAQAREALAEFTHWFHTAVEARTLGGVQ